MEWELFEKMASELATEKQTTTLMFALHNEPLLDKRLFEWVKYIKVKSGEKRCVIVTNGELLDKYGLVQMLHSGLDQLIVSLNAHAKETYEVVNAGLDFDRVMKNVHYLLSDRDMKPKVELRFALTKENEHEVPQAVNYWKARGIHTKVRGITNRAGSLDNYARLKPEDAPYTGALLGRIWRRLMATARGAIGCDLPFYQMNVLFNGDVILCCHDWNRATVVGNARTSSLREIWNSDRMNEIRQLILRKRYQQINSCRECSLAQ